MKQMKTKSPWFISSLMAGGLVMLPACSDDDNNNVPDEIQQTGDVLNLEGTWVSDCLANSILELSHTRRQYEFQLNRNFAKIEFLYDSDSCENRIIEYRVDGNYRTDRLSPEADLEAYPIDFEIGTASITPLNSTAVDILNGVSFCGIDEWTEAQATDITNRECLGFQVNENDTIFEIFEIRDNNQLLFGQNFLFLNETDSAERPRELDEDVIYLRQ